MQRVWPVQGFQAFRDLEEAQDLQRCKAFEEVELLRQRMGLTSSFMATNLERPGGWDRWTYPCNRLLTMASDDVAHISRLQAPTASKAWFGVGDEARKPYWELLESEKDRLGMKNGSTSGDVEDKVVEKPQGQATWKELLWKVKNPEKAAEEERLALEISVTESKFKALQVRRQLDVVLWGPKEEEAAKELEGAFDALSAEAEARVEEAFSKSRLHNVLVTHKSSNIDVSGAIIRCLLPGAWLNDEVINVYMELLKERESRNPKRFLRCHFFNTFFYNKLFKDGHRYDYKAVRRWTTQRKIGYKLSDCDKILVPVHQNIHWCLAVIDVREKKVEYLDSLKGNDPHVLEVLLRYFVDEVKDKSGKDVDKSAWHLSFSKDIPEQENGCDCGMFMLKYADFHSRGAKLCFTQNDMNFFRKKTAWEILQLVAT